MGVLVVVAAGNGGGGQANQYAGRATVHTSQASAQVAIAHSLGRGDPRSSGGGSAIAVVIWPWRAVYLT